MKSNLLTLVFLVVSISACQKETVSPDTGPYVERDCSYSSQEVRQMLAQTDDQLLNHPAEPAKYYFQNGTKMTTAGHCQLAYNKSGYPSQYTLSDDDHNVSNPQVFSSPSTAVAEFRHSIKTCLCALK